MLFVSRLSALCQKMFLFEYSLKKKVDMIKDFFRPSCFWQVSFSLELEKGFCTTFAPKSESNSKAKAKKEAMTTEQAEPEEKPIYSFLSFRLCFSSSLPPPVLFSCENCQSARDTTKPSSEGFPFIFLS